MDVQTTKGLIDRDLLVTKDIVTEESNARITATEWYFEGELVRRDVNINMLSGLSLFNKQEPLNRV